MFLKLLSIKVNNPPNKIKYFPNNKIDKSKIDSLINPVIVLFPFDLILKLTNDKIGRM